MATIEELPSDIIFEIVVRLSNLRQLWSVISSCRQLYQAFDQRRSLILQQVFKNQLNPTDNGEPLQNRPRVGLQLRASHVRRELTAARAVVDRCHTRSQDALCLHAAAWGTFSNLDHSLWLDCSWGQQLVDRYATTGRHDLAVQCASTLWKRLTGGHVVGRPKPHLDNARLCNQGAAHSGLAQKLVIMYLDAGRHDDAISVLRTCYELVPNFNSYGLLSAVMRYYRASDHLSELSLVPFFQERIMKEKTETIAGARGSRTSTARSRFQFTHYLVMVLMRAEQHAEAIDAMNAAVDLALQETSNDLVPVGLSRKLIKTLQEQHRYDEALIVRKRVLDALTSITGTRRSRSTSQLIAWSKEYTSDLRLVHREEEAINVEKAVWAQFRAQAAVHIDRGLLYHARNAAWTLARSYREQYEVEKAVGVQLDYEGLFNARPNRLSGDTQLFWPGSTPDRRIGYGS